MEFVRQPVFSAQKGLCEPGYPLLSAGAGNGGTSPKLVEEPQISWRKLTEEALAALPGQRITTDLDGRIVRVETAAE